MRDLKSLFLLDPEVHFLNHGSFGAVPRPVFEVWQDWQQRLERQPVAFLGRELPGLLRAARERLAQTLVADPDDLLFVPNATLGVNLVARSLRLAPGDEVLASNHEYGACDRIWEFVCGGAGARYVQQPLPLPAANTAAQVDAFWQGVTARTRVIFLSHITSPTALRLPVEAICQRARAAGILTVIDAAHAPGQIALDLKAQEADFVTGNLHKWAMAPKGAAFLYVRREHQAALDPLVVSWGRLPGNEANLAGRLQWMGTADPSAWLSVPAALDFAVANDWASVSADCHALLRETLLQIAALTGLPPAYPPESDAYVQMGIARLPAACDLEVLKARLYDDFRVEVPLIDWAGEKFVRVSIQGYNTAADTAALLAGLQALLPSCSVAREVKASEGA